MRIRRFQRESWTRRNGYPWQRVIQYWIVGTDEHTGEEFLYPDRVAVTTER